jgi:Glycosyltransferase (GlcNAc)
LQIDFGTPHYWDTVSRLFQIPNMAERASTPIRQRIKHMMGYPEMDRTLRTNAAGQHQTNDPSHNITFELEHFGLGQERSRDAYLQFAEIDLLKMTCGPMKWCSDGSLE